MNILALRDLKGFGPKSEKMLLMVGVTSVDEYVAVDVFELYALLKEGVPGIVLNSLYAIIDAQEGLHR